MTYTRFDDDYDEAMADLSHEAFRIYTTAFTYSRRHQLGGRFRPQHFRALCRAQGVSRPAAVRQELLDARDIDNDPLWIEEGDEILVRGYEKRNPLTDTERSRRFRERKANVDETPMQRGKNADAPVEQSPENPEQTAPTASLARTRGPALGYPTPIPTVSNETEMSARSGTEITRQVFDAYCVAAGKNGRYVLTDDRHRLIAKALKTYPLEDVLDAVKGWRKIPHNRGENERRTVFNDLELLLRDAQHIERFRDAERGVGLSTSGAASLPDLAAQLGARA